MVTKEQLGVVEIEVDGPMNENLIFLPQNRQVRGRWDWSRVGHGLGDIARLKGGWPTNVIPGQTIGVDLDASEGYVAEPLHDPQHEKLREFIREKLNMAIPPELERFPGIHVPTWLFWMRRAVDGGFARVIQGELPDVETLRKQNPRTDFIRREVVDKRDKLIAKLVNMLIAEKSPEQQAELMAMLED